MEKEIPTDDASTIEANQPIREKGNDSEAYNAELITVLFKNLNINEPTMQQAEQQAVLEQHKCIAKKQQQENASQAVQLNQLKESQCDNKERAENQEIWQECNKSEQKTEIEMLIENSFSQIQEPDLMGRKLEGVIEHDLTSTASMETLRSNSSERLCEATDFQKFEENAAIIVNTAMEVKNEQFLNYNDYLMECVQNIIKQQQECNSKAEKEELLMEESEKLKLTLNEAESTTTLSGAPDSANHFDISTLIDDINRFTVNIQEGHVSSSNSNLNWSQLRQNLLKIRGYYVSSVAADNTSEQEEEIKQAIEEIPIQIECPKTASKDVCDNQQQSETPEFIPSTFVDNASKLAELNSDAGDIRKGLSDLGNRIEELDENVEQFSAKFDKSLLTREQAEKDMQAIDVLRKDIEQRLSQIEVDFMVSKYMLFNQGEPSDQ
ncbi:uncharacterized protein LOC115632859 isoform X2 [Scaptodrosophila lebanonensis]|uniref:Uncharacterized protein LOC115632859 isoform X2 n=1 Tax=Drosophila lebanonensis TaxID=7225 RepID=A0A6J2UBX2_DROLE|nr:uncharacterized protein LOC115632859 isoform X2 [Scaptodrosophila lebanonensis]